MDTQGRTMHSYRVASMLHVATNIAGALRALLIQGERGAPICLYSDLFSPSNQKGRAQERTMHSYSVAPM